MPAALLPKHAVVDRLLATFRSKGFDGASLSDIAAATGLGRASLYHHFPGGKEQMAGAVFDLVDAWIDTEIVNRARGSGPPAIKLAAMIDAVNAFYDGGRKPCILGAFAFGQGGQLFATRLKTAFERWIAAFALLARESGASRSEARRRAEACVAAIQGAVVLAGALHDPKPFKAMLSSLPVLLLDAAKI